ncbi:MAG: MarR family winged helix-turn-helix transcriptional regulator [Lachnospiraceae bacterium]
MGRTENVQKLLEMVRQVSIVHNKILSTKRQYMDGEELYMREAHFVLAIGPGNVLTMTELTEKLEVTPGAVSQLAKRMEEKGFVQRIPAKEDRRINEITLTEKGEQLYHLHRKFDQEQYREFSRRLQEYSDEELEFLMQFEQKIESIFREVVENDKND